ncbi:hypothetical protein BRADI_4g12889v3 [Brachypodium distachyon]|uniref:BTB domain-containing protein n=1 Tax=Brachypodium distachyon TaxID=15368 RepID=A0A0Q3L4U7_BRADI|nr:hypothetical protein BRADI_4g12889v3 [Brachypodium distachyon]
MSVSSPSSIGTSPLSASAIVAHAVSGSHVLKIDGYSCTKGLGHGKSIKSEKFTVGGHRWCLHYYPDGENSESADWISIFLNLDHGGANEVTARFGFSLLDRYMQPVPLYSKSSKEIDAFSSKESSCDVTVAKEIFTEPILPAVLVPPSDMASHLGQLLSTGDGADVTFDIGGESFAAHRYMLAARSSVFKAELLGPMKEKTAAHVKIFDMEAKVFKALLHFVYTDTLQLEMEEDTAVMAQHLLVAADKYNMERLKLLCEEKLCNLISRSTVATTLTLAEQHGCGALKNACFKFLTSPGNLKADMASKGFEHLRSSCPSVLEELMAKLAP